MKGDMCNRLWMMDHGSWLGAGVESDAWFRISRATKGFNKGITSPCHGLSNGFLWVLVTKNLAVVLFCAENNTKVYPSVSYKSQAMQGKLINQSATLSLTLRDNSRYQHDLSQFFFIFTY